MEVLNSALSYTTVALEHGLLSASSLTAENLADGKAKQITWGMSRFLKRAVLVQMSGMLTGLCKDKSVLSELERVCQKFLDISAFETLLGQSSRPTSATTGESEQGAAQNMEIVAVGEEDTDYYEAFTKTLTASAKALASLCFDLLTGELEEDFHNIWQSSENYEKTLKQILLVESEEACLFVKAVCWVEV